MQKKKTKKTVRTSTVKKAPNKTKKPDKNKPTILKQSDKAKIKQDILKPVKKGKLPIKPKKAIKQAKKTVIKRISARTTKKVIKKKPIRRTKLPIKPQKAVKPIKKAKKPIRKYTNLSKYNKIQKILGEYLKVNGIKHGEDFTKVASLIYKQTKDSPLKYVQQNFETIYKINVSGAEVKTEIPYKDFETDFPFYNYKSIFSDIIYDDVSVRFKWADWEFKGTSFDFLGWFDDSGLYKLCRIEYNNSPVGLFIITETDNKTFVEYTLDKEPLKGYAPVEKEAEKIEIKEGVKKPTGAIDKELELEKAKQETERLKQKTIEKILELKKAFPEASLEDIKKLLNL